MKQIEKTPEISALLKNSGVEADKVSVYEAIALNTRPIRKNHPLYKGAVADRSLLLEMAAALSIESRPVQIQHDKDGLPSGRAFHGKVLDKGSETELRVLFFVDKTEDKLLAKLESGTVDQVSVSVVPKKLLNSKSGFDYLGPQSKPENVWTGDDGEGNIIGKSGIHARLLGLEQWSELSLVGMGGAENARIISHEESYFGSSYQKLAASGKDPSLFVLEATLENETMDLTALTDKIASTSAALALSTADVATLTATNATLTARVAELEAKITAADKPDEALTAANASVVALTATNTTLVADNTVALTALKDIAKKVLTASGKPNDAIPETVAELNTLISTTSATLTAAMSAGGNSNDAVDDVKKDKVYNDVSSFRILR